MRSIDADALKEELCKEYRHFSQRIAISQVFEAIKKAPTLDIVPVVRCKDCKYMTEHYDTDGNAPYWTCSEWDSGTDYDGFCHYAERRTNATD